VVSAVTQRGDNALSARSLSGAASDSAGGYLHHCECFVLHDAPNGDLMD